MRRLLLATGLLLLWLAAPAAAQNRTAELCAHYRFSDEPAWSAQLTPAKETTVTTEDVQIRSADGTLISARVYLPDAYKGQKLPTVLVMSPYHAFLVYYKEFEDANAPEAPPFYRGSADCIAPFLLQRGYAVVLADMRGTHNTDDCFNYGGKGDQEDGFATVQWIAGQSWSSGKVGMYGVSHVGMSQYSAAVTTPPALKAIIPIAPITSFYRYLYSGGVHYETNLLTPPAYMYGTGAPPPTNVTQEGWAQNVLNTSCGTQDVANGMSLDGTFTDYWLERDYPSMGDRIKTAVFHVHGTKDENVKMDHFGAIWEALERHDVPRKLLIGPWEHREPQIPNWHLHALRFYEHHLRGVDTGMMDEPVATLLDQTGTERFSDTFPVDPNGTKVLEAWAGKLLWGGAKPGEATYQDVPGMKRDQVRATEGVRVIYKGDPVDQPVRISGTPVFEVVASIDQSDTNFAVHLSDIAPDGKITYLTRGYLDARLRNGRDKPSPVTPGEAARYRVELHSREWLLEPGHSLEVLLASSDSCHWGPDPGCTSSGVVSDQTAAQVTVHEGTGETRLFLPTAPLDTVIRKAKPPVAVATPKRRTPRRYPLSVRLRRLSGGRVQAYGRAPVGRPRVTVKLRRGGRTIATRRVRPRKNRLYRVTFRARGRRLNALVTARGSRGRIYSARARLR